MAVSSQARAVSIRGVRGLSSPAKLNTAGLLLAAAGMVAQMVSGSTLYPSIAGPIALIVTAILVAFGPRRAAPWVGLAVPLVLGIGALAAAVMTGAFIDQLTDVGKPGLLAGTLMHVVGLVAAVAGGVGMVLRRRGPLGRER
jgi:hypothetical protein